MSYQAAKIKDFPPELSSHKRRIQMKKSYVYVGNVLPEMNP